MIKVKCRGYEGVLVSLDSNMERAMSFNGPIETWWYTIEVAVSLTETVTICSVCADEIEFI